MKHDIIIFGMNKFSDWENGRNHNRSYYILQEMLKRQDIGKILYIDALPVKRIKALNTWREIWFSRKPGYKKKSVFSHYKELKREKLYHYSTILSVVDWQMMYRELNKLVQSIGIIKPVIWSYYPLNVDYFDYIDSKLKVIHLDDDWKKFKDMQQKTSIDYIDVLRKNYNQIADKADFIFTASDELLEIFMGHDNSYWIDDVHKDKISDYDWAALVEEMFNKMYK